MPKITKRRRFTNQEKLNLVTETELANTTVTAVATAHGLNESTLRGWIKTKEKLEQSVFYTSHQHELKSVQRDWHPTLTQELKLYVAAMQRESPTITLTLDVISQQALQIRDRLLNPHVISDFERRHLTKFKASHAWAGKWMARNSVPIATEAEADRVHIDPDAPPLDILHMDHALMIQKLTQIQVTLLRHGILNGEPFICELKKLIRTAVKRRREDKKRENEEQNHTTYDEKHDEINADHDHIYQPHQHCQHHEKIVLSTITH